MESSLRGCYGPLRPIAAALIAIFGLSPLASLAAPAVINCNDGGPGSLRQSVIDSSNTDAIDLTQLQCTITLTTGALIIGQNSLTINGSGSDKLTIDGSQNSGGYNIFLQTSTGHLNIHDMAVRHGTLFLNNPHKYVGGGCIFSAGTVSIYDSIVSDCKMITGPDSNAVGGAVAANRISVFRSAITGNRVYNGKANVPGLGGGLYAKQILLNHSVISDNSAGPGAGGPPNLVGGGLYGKDYMKVAFSTISGNTANVGAALSSGGALYIYGSTISGNRGYAQGAISTRNSTNLSQIVNSTISGNSALPPLLSSTQASAISVSGGPLQILNSTIAFNVGRGSAGAVSMYSDALTMYSSIVADNFPADVWLHDSTTHLYGTYNLIVNTSAPLPSKTITSCPKLEALANNGGPTLTHALQHTSPAISAGLNLMTLPDDQRALGFSRIFGPKTDIGAIEWRGGADNGIFNSGFDFPTGFCELR